MKNKKYALITPAHNEELYIEKTIQSVIQQTILPVKWVIVSDRSTDRTDDIVKNYMRRYDFIELCRLDGDSIRNFGHQVLAINAGYVRLKYSEFDFIGNLDADVSFDSNYYEIVLSKFQKNPMLGIAGGFIFEKCIGKFKSRQFNTIRSVPNAVQFFRRECFDSIGGYMPLKYGGHDWVIQVIAQMSGWRVEAFPELRVFHHRITGTGDGKILKGFMRMGLMDYSVGSHPLFEVVKCVRRIKGKPYIIGSLTRLAGYMIGYCKKEKRMVSSEFIKFLRQEQISRIKILSDVFQSDKDREFY